MSALGEEEGGDIRIQGSDLVADGEISLQAADEVAILDAHHSQSSEELKQAGTAVLSLSLQNEYDQLSRAIKAVKAAERDLRHAENDYDEYKSELAAQEDAFKRLQQDLAEGVGFVEQADIDDFERRLDRLRDDREFYEANIALATVTLASRTTALIQQGGQAAASSGSYGFNVGLELDIDAFETQVDEYYSQSRASNLVANQIEINAGTTASVRGSNLQAQDSIDISAEDIDIQAGVNSGSSRERQQQVNFTYSWDLLGGNSSSDLNELLGDSSADTNDLGGSIGGDGSRSDSENSRFVNSQLLAGNIRLNAGERYAYCGRKRSRGRSTGD